MRLAAVVDRIKASPKDIRLLRRFTADLARSLATLSEDSLSELKRALAGIEGDQASFEAGYRLALADLLSAHATRAREVENERDARELVINENWHPLIRAIHDGASRTGEIARRVDKDKAQVSRWLNAMEHLGIVESFVSPGWARKRYQLTLQGDRVAKSLGHDPARARVADSFTTFALRVFNSLRVEGRLPRAQVERQAEALLTPAGLDSRHVCDLLAAKAQAEGAFDEIDGAWEVRFASARRRIQKQLAQATRSRSVPAFLKAHEADLTRGGAFYIRVSPGLENVWTSWKIAMNAPQVQLLDWPAVMLDEVEMNANAILIYDSSSQLRFDLGSYAAQLRSFEAIARRKLVVSDSESEPLPEGYEELRVA